VTPPERRPRQIAGQGYRGADQTFTVDRIIMVVPNGEAGRKLRNRMLANRAHLFVFMTKRDVPFTNNVSERNLRPSVIFRKVTNCFRCEWGPEDLCRFSLGRQHRQGQRRLSLRLHPIRTASQTKRRGDGRGGVSNYQISSAVERSLGSRICSFRE
jgi:hypothetical protein